MIKKYKKVASYILELTEEEKVALLKLVNATIVDTNVTEGKAELQSVSAKMSVEEKMVYGKKDEEPSEA